MRIYFATDALLLLACSSGSGAGGWGGGKDDGWGGGGGSEGSGRGPSFEGACSAAGTWTLSCGAKPSCGSCVGAGPVLVDFEVPSHSGTTSGGATFQYDETTCQASPAANPTCPSLSPRSTLDFAHQTASIVSYCPADGCRTCGAITCSLKRVCTPNDQPCDYRYPENCCSHICVHADGSSGITGPFVCRASG